MSIQEEAYTQIIEQISLSRTQIITAKEYILHQFLEERGISASVLLQRFLTSVDAVAPESVILHPSVDSKKSINQAAKYISWSLAFSEALWSLVHNGFLILADGNITSTEPYVSWTTKVMGSGGTDSSWSFPKYKYSMPINLIIAPSLYFGGSDYLIDPDLFLTHLTIENMQRRVKEALYDAILCFRAELYTPCLVMLTKGLEGAWVELGLALIDTLDDQQQHQLKKQSEILSSEYSSIAKIIKTVVEVYEKQDLFESISRKSEVKLEDLRNAAIWADTVRESRNFVHYGKDIDIPNDFEKIATLILGVPTHFKLIYKLIDTCKVNSH